MYDYPDYAEPEHPERFYFADGLPDIPIAPSVLSEIVQSKLREDGNIVPTKSAKMIENLCRGFNECIRLNTPTMETKRVSIAPFKSKEISVPKYEDKQMLVFSPNTGSAKSLSAKVYISLLKKESSFVVVSRVSDAIEFCEDINSFSGNPNYARCTYQVSDANPDNEMRVEKRELVQYRCIVVTHNMFITANKDLEDNEKSNMNKYFKPYGGRNRELVIIDERISLYEKYFINHSQVENLLEITRTLSSHTSIDLSSVAESLTTLTDIFNHLIQRANNETLMPTS